MRVQLEQAGGGFANPRNAQGRAAFAVFRLHDQPQVLARQQDGLFRLSGILVADHLHFGPVARLGVAPRAGHVEAPLPITRNSQVDVYTPGFGVEMIGQRLGGRRPIGIRDLEQQPVRKNARGFRDGQTARRQRRLVDTQMPEAPGAERERLQVELQGFLEKPVLALQVLGIEEGPLGPNNRFQPPHRCSR